MGCAGLVAVIAHGDATGGHECRRGRRVFEDGRAGYLNALWPKSKDAIEPAEVPDFRLGRAEGASSVGARWITSMFSDHETRFRLGDVGAPVDGGVTSPRSLAAASIAPTGTVSIASVGVSRVGNALIVMACLGL
jgi:hypothetical protein